ncbi:MAG: FHA domain-containing protein [Planctomycetota bacterium]
MSQSRKLLLKVFSGPHMGAEIPLTPGSHSIGSGEGCDVILSDQLLAGHHATVDVEEGQIHCTAASDCHIVVDGAAIAQIELDEFQVFALGNTYLAIGPEDVAWPKHLLPGYEPALEKSADGTEDLDGQEEEEKNKTEDANAAKQPAPQLSNRTSIVVLACLLLVLFIAAGVGNALVPSQPQRSQEQVSQLEELKTLVEELYSESEMLVKESGGILIVSGFVSTEPEEEAIEKRIQQFDPGVVVRVRNSEGLAVSAGTYLASSKLRDQLQILPGEIGEIIVKGKTNQIEEWHALEARISRNLKPRLINADEVKLMEPQEEQSEEAQTVAVSRPMRGTPPTISAPGAVKQVQSTGTDDLPINTALDIDVLAVSISGEDYRLVTLANDIGIFQGGSIQGHKFIQVDKDKIVVQKDGIKSILYTGIEDGS